MSMPQHRFRFALPMALLLTATIALQSPSISLLQGMEAALRAAAAANAAMAPPAAAPAHQAPAHQ